MTESLTPFSPYQALNTLWQEISPELIALASTELHTQLEEQFAQLHTYMSAADQQAFPLGQQLLCLLIGNYPQFTPIIPRQLLWYFGGDCLHFLSDEEISEFQQLEDEGVNLRGAPVSLH